MWNFSFFVSVRVPSLFQAESCHPGLCLQVLCASAGHNAVLYFAVEILSRHLSFCSRVSCLGTCLVDEVVLWVMTVLEHGDHFDHHNVMVLGW